MIGADDFGRKRSASRHRGVAGRPRREDAGSPERRGRTVLLSYLFGDDDFRFGFVPDDVRAA